MSYHFTEPATTLDIIARITGRKVRVTEVIREDEIQKATANWSVTYSDGPYLLTAFLIHPDHGYLSTTLKVWVDGSTDPVHSQTCAVGATNTNWLVGLVPGSAFANAVGSILAASSVTLGAVASGYFSWQLIKFDLA